MDIQNGINDMKQWFANLQDRSYGWSKDANGLWHHSGVRGDFDENNRGCRVKDLNFAFGAGLMFRAYVRHLNFPADMPILGGIEKAPELGTPWQSITGWEGQPTDLASKLPALLCRHGVCSATLPGCP